LVDLQKISDHCTFVAKRLGLKNSAAKLAIEKVVKSQLYDTEDEVLRAVLILLYWATPTIGGKLKPLSVKVTDFTALLEGHHFSVENEDAVIEMVNAFENSLVCNFDISSLGAIGEKITHFSAKLTHSKAGGSVFIPISRVSNLPYLFSGSLQKISPLPVDLAKNDGDANAQSVVKLINGDTISVDQNVVNKILEWHQSRFGGSNDAKVLDARVRQILVPNENEDHYVSITPLYAGGISRRIGELDKEIELNGDRIEIPFGGANSQNVSVHGRHLKNVWLFDTPSIDRDIKSAYTVALRGYWVRVDKDLAKAYSEWLQTNPTYGSDRDTLVATAIERKQSPFHRIVHEVIDRLENAMVSCEIAKELLDEKMIELGRDTPDPLPLERSILSGLMTRSAINDLTSRIVLAMTKAEIYSTESTKSRHLKVIPEIIKNRLNVTLGGE
jgi:hypothetical protein